MGCHADEFSHEVVHFAESNGDCMFCHESGTDGRTISTVADDEICQVCHVANSDAIETGSHMDVSCLKCHAPHSSPTQHLFRTAETSLCSGGCHGAHDLGVSHPVGEHIEDKRIGGALSCVSTCHTMHQPGQQNMLQMAALDLCYQCHGEKF